MYIKLVNEADVVITKTRMPLLKKFSFSESKTCLLIFQYDL